MEYRILEAFQSKTEAERRQNLAQLLRLRQKNDKKDKDNDAPA